VTTDQAGALTEMKLMALHFVEMRPKVHARFTHKETR